MLNRQTHQPPPAPDIWVSRAPARCVQQSCGCNEHRPGNYQRKPQFPLLREGQDLDVHDRQASAYGQPGEDGSGLPRGHDEHGDTERRQIG